MQSARDGALRYDSWPCHPELTEELFFKDGPFVNIIGDTYELLLIIGWHLHHPIREIEWRAHTTWWGVKPPNEDDDFLAIKGIHYRSGFNGIR